MGYMSVHTMPRAAPCSGQCSCRLSDAVFLFSEHVLCACPCVYSTPTLYASCRIPWREITESSTSGAARCYCFS